jgi:hypothetical protein
VAFMGARRFTYRLALGRLAKGRHRVSADLSRAKSPRAARRVRVRSLRVTATRDPVARYSPIVYGRDLAEIPGRYENNRTDVPLLAYHESRPEAGGGRTIEYTVIWSNEDGGTDTPALLARWGRTTDIEWVYRVTLDASGRRVAEAFHGPNHETRPFSGRREGDHPLLQTATNNNTLLPVFKRGYRFFPDASAALPAGRSREAVMDANPWSWRVMAQEAAREGRLEAVPSPDTPQPSDLRNYLLAEVAKTTTYPVPPPGGAWVGTSLAVKLRGSDRWYVSDHGTPEWSIQRDIPASTAIELPGGTTAAAVEAVRTRAVPVGAVADYRIDVTALRRGFLLGAGLLPGAPLFDWTGAVTLTPAQPEAELWRAP